MTRIGLPDALRCHISLRKAFVGVDGPTNHDALADRTVGTRGPTGFTELIDIESSQRTPVVGIPARMD